MSLQLSAEKIVDFQSQIQSVHAFLSSEEQSIQLDFDEQTIDAHILSIYRHYLAFYHQIKDFEQQLEKGSVAKRDFVQLRKTFVEKVKAQLSKLKKQPSDDYLVVLENNRQKAWQALQLLKQQANTPAEASS